MKNAIPWFVCNVISVAAGVWAMHTGEVSQQASLFGLAWGLSMFSNLWGALTGGEE